MTNIKSFLSPSALKCVQDLKTALTKCPHSVMVSFTALIALEDKPLSNHLITIIDELNHKGMIGTAIDMREGFSSVFEQLVHVSQIEGGLEALYTI